MRSHRTDQNPSNVSCGTNESEEQTHLIQPVCPVHILFATPYIPVYQHPTTPVKTYLPCLTMAAPVGLSGLSTLARTFSTDDEGKEARRCAPCLLMMYVVKARSS